MTLALTELLTMITRRSTSRLLFLKKTITLKLLVKLFFLRQLLYGFRALPAGGFGLALGLACYVIDILSPKSTEALDSFKCALQQTDNDLAYFNGNKTAQSNNSVSSSYDMLSKLADLKERGALTEEEFNQEKEKLMKNMS